MATVDDNAVFIDTNILIYANVIETPLHEQALAAINTAHDAGRIIWIRRYRRRFRTARRTDERF